MSINLTQRYRANSLIFENPWSPFCRDSKSKREKLQAKIIDVKDLELAPYILTGMTIGSVIGAFVGVAVVCAMIWNSPTGLTPGAAYSSGFGLVLVFGSVLLSTAIGFAFGFLSFMVATTEDIRVDQICDDYDKWAHENGHSSKLWHLTDKEAAEWLVAHFAQVVCRLQ